MKTADILLYVMANESAPVGDFRYQTWLQFDHLVHACGLKNRPDRYLTDRRMTGIKKLADVHQFNVEAHIKRKVLFSAPAMRKY